MMTPSEIKELVQYWANQEYKPGPHILVGYKNNQPIFVTQEFVLHKGFPDYLRGFGLIKTWPVKTSLIDNPLNIIWVEGDSQADAVERYLNRIERN